MSWDEPDDPSDDATGDWVWDLEDRYDLGADEPDPTLAVASSPRAGGVRKHLRSSRPAERPAWEPTPPASAGADIEPTGESPAIDPRRWANKWAIAAAVLVVVGLGGVGWALSRPGPGRPGQPNVAISAPATSTATPASTAASSSTSAAVDATSSTPSTAPAATFFAPASTTGQLLTTPTTRSHTTTATTTKPTPPPATTTATTTETTTPTTTATTSPTRTIFTTTSTTPTTTKPPKTTTTRPATTVTTVTPP